MYTDQSKILPPGGDFQTADEREHSKSWPQEWSTTSPKATGWTTEAGSGCARNCDYAEQSKLETRIILSRSVQDMLHVLRQRFTDHEWQVLLSGVVAEEEGIRYVRCTSYYIPKQRVAGATVENLDCIDAEFIRSNQIIATIHSHVNMSVFFSVTDEKDCCTNSQILYHMVTNNRMEYHAGAVETLPCGMKKIKPATVWLESPPAPTGLENIVQTERTDRVWGVTS